MFQIKDSEKLLITPHMAWAGVEARNRLIRTIAGHIRDVNSNNIERMADMNQKGIQPTTLCYIEKDDKYLMLHRTKKEVDINKDKWIGVGGKFEENESPEECLLREVKEETGFTLTDYQLRGIVTFISDQWVNESMYLFTATGFTGEMTQCEEGELVWVEKDKLFDLHLWEGDKIFLDLLQKESGFFTLKLVYHGDDLIESKVHVYR